MKIICGYQGVGKTTYCKEHEWAYDLDSSGYKKTSNWVKRYINDCLKQFDLGYSEVCISAHRVVIEEILKRNLQKTIDIIVASPGENKLTWEHRLRLRYHQCKKQYALNALNDFLQNYENDIKYYHKLENRKDVRIIKVMVKIKTNLGTQI